LNDAVGYRCVGLREVLPGCVTPVKAKRISDPVVEMAVYIKVDGIRRE
jgi:hypothetical protein